MKAINKDIVREVNKTRSKFLSILIIMFLGVFVYNGLKEVPPTMEKTLNNYLREVNVYDLKVNNSFALNKEDLNKVLSFEDVEKSEYYFSINLKEEKNNLNIDVQSLPEEIAKPKIVTGKLPTNNNEIVLTESLSTEYQLGDTINFKEDETNSLADSNVKLQANNSYTVVGFVYGVDYPANATNNSANNEYFAYVKKENFVNEVVSGVNIILKDVTRNDFTKDDYYAQVNEKRDKLITLLQQQREINEQNFKKDNLKTIADNNKKLEEEKEKLALAEKHLATMKQFISEEEYNSQFAKLSEAENTIAEQAEKLQKAEESTNEFTYPKFNVENVKGNLQYKQFIESAKNFVSIANIFSVFLFAVALLVSLTTITRMIDEDRINIGTLKSLGYSNQAIAKKYYSYALISTLIGSILGIIASYLVVVPLIYNAYARFLTFKVPNLSYSFITIATAFIISILCVTLAVFIPLRKSVVEKTAYLLRPKAPKNGSRILLEYIPFIWKKLSFLRKVTFRNIFRYKIRMLMMIFGVLGCLALMFIGFGIRYSVQNISHEQYNVISKFDVIASYNPYITAEERKDIASTVENNANIVVSKEVNITAATIEEGNNVLDNLMIVAFDNNNIQDFVTLKNSGENLELSDDGIIINSKLAYLHKLNIGDNIELTVSSKKYSFKVAGITDNYFGHVGYISKTYYEKVFAKEYSSNSYLINAAGDKDKVKNIIEKLEINKNIVNIHNNVVYKETLNNFIKGIDIIVLVMVLCSITLALVVLYNLININISERLRELSTIKVLGFYNSEVTSYVFREIFYLALIGVVLGNYVGYIMYQKIILELAAREMLFSQKVSIWVYGLSSGITLIIVVLVMLIMHRRMKKVNMVEALKGVE